MSDTTSSAIPGWARAGALSWGLLALLAVVGCGAGSGGDDMQPQTAFAFDMGPPLSDTSYAIVVQSEYGVDTLRTAVYRRKLRELRQQQSQQTQSQGQAASVAGTASHRRMLEQFVTRHVMAGAAKANDVEVDSARLERKMERRRNQYESEAALRAALKEQGLTVDSVRKQQANTLRIQQLGEKWAGQVDMQRDTAETNNVQGRYPEKKRQLRQLLKQYIERGRSTPGPEQSNWKGQTRWEQLSW